MDFTLEKFKKLISLFPGKDCSLISFFEKKSNSNFILRHDVDRSLSAALKMAKLEAESEIKATYFFRVPYTFDISVIDTIFGLNHEIGYHYEVFSKSKGDCNKAINLFIEELKLFKRWDAKTICMHGSPLSKWDNLLLWKKFDYHDFGIIGEPYFDIDYTQVYYLTDTGRSWNLEKHNIRDKVDTWFDYGIDSTMDIIFALRSNLLPEKILLNIHPHRWSDNIILWGRELIWQNIKNIGKRMLAKRR